MSTIYALSTGSGRAGLAVIRISGPEANAAAESLAGTLPLPRRAGLRGLRRRDGSVLDEAVVLVFPEGESYTGEAVVELQCHGSPAVVSAVLMALSEQPGLRPAEPGEFTRRAFDNGRMDLTQVEGLADLLSAETEAQRKQAWSNFRREATEVVEGWRSRLVHALALVEASIDFSDQDISPATMSEIRAIVKDVRDEIGREIDGSKPAERLRTGFEVAIIGPPNSGKSTLLNYLAGRKAALTSSTPGTTRDVVEVHMDVRGLPVTFLDTAGMRETSDDLERQGIERAMDRARESDMRLIVKDSAEDFQEWIVGDGDLAVIGKADLNPCDEGVSGITGAGVDALLDRIHGGLTETTSRAGLFGRHRHRIALSSAHGELSAIITKSEVPEEVLSVLLWKSVSYIGSLTESVGVEDVLDKVFLEFCIGK